MGIDYEDRQEKFLDLLFTVRHLVLYYLSFDFNDRSFGVYIYLPRSIVVPIQKLQVMAIQDPLTGCS